MLKRISKISESLTDPVPAILGLLDTGSDVIRTAAIRALAAYGDARVHPALLAALTDPDPDVRTDAMDALKCFATQEDGEKIAASLAGDPVREVKHAAIEILAGLNDQAAIPLLRALARSRAEDQVAWEDGADAWDDWLDLQTTAIRALGEMNVSEAIPELLALRDDEFGQNVDFEVFEALARMPGEGPTMLLSVAKTEAGRSRKRALETFAKADRETLLPYLDYLLGDDSPEVRMLALPLLESTDDRAAYLALKDNDAGIRRQAVIRFAPARNDLAIAALSDGDEKVQAAALDRLSLPLEKDLAQALQANILAWLPRAGADLTSSAVRFLPLLCGEDALQPLQELIANFDRPLECRLAATKAIAALGCTQRMDILINLLTNEAQQIRAAALTGLAALARSGDAAAAQAIADAIVAGLVEQPEVGGDVDGDGDPGLAASKVEGDGQPRVVISAEGEIVENTDPAADFVTSTLGNIPFRVVETAEPDEAEAEEPRQRDGQKKTRKRVAVEGPDSIAQDLARAALRIGGAIPAENIGEALVAATSAKDEMTRRAAYEALESRAGGATLTPAEISAAEIGLQSESAVIRGFSAGVLAKTGARPEKLAGCLGDSDAIVRSVALRALGTEHTSELVAFFTDPVLAVRQAALDAVLESGDTAVLMQALKVLLDGKWVDTLARAVECSPAAAEFVANELSKPDLAEMDAYVLLDAMAQAGSVRA